MKASLDLNSMKEFATNHVEKFVLGGVVLLLLLFAVKAVATVSGGAPFTPDQLSDEADRAQQAINRTTWAGYFSSKPELELPDYGKLAARMFEPVPIEPYRPPGEGVLSTPPFPPRNKRDVPKLLPLVGLRAVGGNGALQMSGQPGAGMTGTAPGDMVMTRGIQGKRWVVVTGLLPNKEQIEAFSAAFQDAMYRDPRQDVPTYVGYWIEKAEIGLNSAAQQPDWKPIALQDAFGEMRYWGAAGSREVVHQKYVPRPSPYRGPPMVFPLPPRTNAPWDSDVVHPPEIPLLADMTLAERGMGYPGQPLADQSDEQPEGAKAEPGEGETETVGPAGASPFGLGMPPGPGRTPGPGYPGGMYPGAGGYSPGAGGYSPGAGGYSPGGMYPGASGYSGGYPGGYPGGDEGSMYEESAQPYASGTMPYGMSGMAGPGMVSRVQEVVEYQLFRFFDFAVEPGRRYQYRVRLGLFNPNYKVESRFLAKEDLSKEWWLQTEWSGPSNVVLVPRDSRLLAGSVKPPREQPGIYTDPSVRVIAVTLRMEDGLETSEEYTVFRGHLANFEGKLVKQRGPGPYGMTGMSGDYYGYGDMPGGGPTYSGESSMYPDMGGGGGRRQPKKAAAKEEEEAETISHATGLIVLDLSGGDRLHRSDASLTEPGSLLLVDADGNLLVQNELDEAEEFAVFHVAEEPKGPKRKAKPGEGTYPGYEGSMEQMYEGMMEEGGMYGEGTTPRRGRRSRRYSDEG